MRKTIPTLFCCLLMAAAVVACGKQQGIPNAIPGSGVNADQPGPTVAALRALKRKRHPHGKKGGSGAPYTLTGPGCIGETYCLEFAPGDSTTVMAHVYGAYVGATHCQGTEVFPENISDYSGDSDLAPTFTTYTVTPSSYSFSSCFWETTVAVTVGTSTTSTSGGAGGPPVICIAGSSNWCGIEEDWEISAVASHPPSTPIPSPTPGIDIFDYNPKVVVTNATPSAIAGQMQVLGAQATQSGETLSNCNWTFTGQQNVVADYKQDGSQPVTLQTSNVNPLAFFWYASGTNSAQTASTVKVDCQDQTGQHHVASTVYTVNQPTLTSISASYATMSGAPSQPMTMPSPCATPTPTATGTWSDGVLLSNFNNTGTFQCGNWSLVFGNPELDNFHPGVSWTFVANIPQGAGSTGIMGMIQLRNISRTGTKVSGGTWQSVDNNPGNWCLDTTGGNPIYDGYGLQEVGPGQNTLTGQNDSPGQNMTSAGLASIIQDLKFRDYFVYQPSNAPVGQSIYITVGSLLNWETSASANLQNGTWTFSGSATGSQPASGSIDKTLPIWSC